MIATPGSNDRCLQEARAAILADERPAYVKNSELCYLEVNSAYAAIWNSTPADMIGKTSDQIFESADQADRDENERRSLVFGKRQTALFDHPTDEQRYRIRIERHKCEDGAIFITGKFEPITSVRIEKLEPNELLNDNSVAIRGDLSLMKSAIEASPVPMAVVAEDGRIIAGSTSFMKASADERADFETTIGDNGTALVIDRSAGGIPLDSSGEKTLPEISAPQSDAQTAEIESFFNTALEDLDVGILVYDREDRLLYANATINTLFDGALPPLVPGINRRAVLESVFDSNIFTSEKGDQLTADDRQTWIDTRLRGAGPSRRESLERLTNGRWIKSINRRLENGNFVGIRFDVSEATEREMYLNDRLMEVQMLQSVLDQLPNAVFVKDEHGRHAYANREYEHLCDRSLDEIIGKTDRELFGDAADAIGLSDAKIRESREVFEIEEVQTRADGEEVPVLIRKSVFERSEGKAYIVGTSTNMSAIRAREDEAFEARRLAEAARSDLESVLDAMQMGVVVVDRDMNVELANSAFFKIWKQEDRAEVIGQHFRGLIDINRHNAIYDIEDDDWEDFVAQRVAEIKSGNVAPREMIRADGFTLIYSVKPLSDDKRMICYFDVTELKAREREVENARSDLEQASQLLSNATGAMAQGLLIVDSEKILYTNRVFHELMDVPENIVSRGQNWEGFLQYCCDRGDYGDDGRTSQLRETILHNIKHRIAHSLERTVPSGKWLRIDSVPSGENQMIITYTDISESKVREDELERLLVKAEEADRAKSEFLANMSHEIRTPMNGVLGMAELLAKTGLDTRQKTFVDVISKSGTALLSIINNILDFSKIDAGKMVLENAPFDLGDLVEDVATLFSSKLIENDIEMIVRISPNLPEQLVGDSGRMRQILSNLTGNAAKFTETGHILIDVDAQVSDNDRCEIKLEVKDTGIGIPEDKLEVVFDKFSQVDGSSTRRHEGTGLGLAITARLVELMGGEISVTSEVGEGTTFTMSFDFAVSGTKKPPATAPVDVTGARVVAIDDNPVNRRILIEQLSSWGFDACAAESGQIGIEVLQASEKLGLPVDAVVLDYHMPDANGVQVAEEIRKLKLQRKPAIVMLTSIDVRSDDPAFHQLDVQAQLMKPARASEMLETMVSVLQHLPPMLTTKASSVAADTDATGAAISEAASHAPAPSEATASASTGLTQLDVLVAEDNDVNQIVFTQILGDLGVNFKVVDNGEKAVEALKSEKPKMVLMDVSMPILNGHDATRAIRKYEEPLGLRTPIVGVTAHALQGDREACFAAGMDDYLSKPVSPDLLEGKIRKWIDDLLVDQSQQNKG